MEILQKVLDWLAGHIPAVNTVLTVIGSAAVVLFVVLKSRLRNIPLVASIIKLLSKYSLFKVKQPPKEKP